MEDIYLRRFSLMNKCAGEKTHKGRKPDWGFVEAPSRLRRGVRPRTYGPNGLRV
jgi:hypothetical protein